MNDITFILDLAEMSRGFKANKDEELIVIPSGSKVPLTEISFNWEIFKNEHLPLLLYRAAESINTNKKSTITLITTIEGIKVINHTGIKVFQTPELYEKGLEKALRFCLTKPDKKEKKNNG